MTEDSYRITYFDCRGYTEPVRFILSYAGAKWEDVRHPLTFPVVIPPELKARLPYGQLPFLEFGENSLSQAKTIARFLARKYDLVGDGELEAAKCDEVVDASKDLEAMWMPYYIKYIWYPYGEGEQVETEKAEALKKVIADSKARYLTKFESLLEANDGHLVGKRLTWADLIVAHNVDDIQIGLGVPLTEDFPAVAKLIQKVYNTPGIKEWIEKRPKTPF